MVRPLFHIRARRDADILAGVPDQLPICAVVLPCRNINMGGRKFPFLRDRTKTAGVRGTPNLLGLSFYGIDSFLPRAFFSLLRRTTIVSLRSNEVEVSLTLRRRIFPG